MKKILLLIIFSFSFTHAIAYAGEGVVDGIWTGEGAHGTFELLLKEHNGEVFGSLITKATRTPRDWRSYRIVYGTHHRDGISFTVITDGCTGLEEGGLIGFKGNIEKEEMRVTLTVSLPCTKEEEIIFHKE